MAREHPARSEPRRRATKVAVVEIEQGVDREHRRRVSDAHQQCKAEISPLWPESLNRYDVHTGADHEEVVEPEPPERQRRWTAGQVGSDQRLCTQGEPPEVRERL